MPRPDDLPQFPVLLFKQIQNAYCFRVGGVLRRRSKLSSGKVVLFARGDRVSSFGFDRRIARMSMRLFWI